MKTPFLTFLTLCFTVYFSFSQEYKFGDVTKDELKQTIHPKDSSASAAVLMEEAYLTMKFEEKWFYHMKVVKKVKIYSQDGYDYATITIPYYYGDNNSSREDIKKWH